MKNERIVAKINDLQDVKGRIVMVTQENDLPYDRPQLSKGYLEDVKKWRQA